MTRLEAAMRLNGCVCVRCGARSLPPLKDAATATAAAWTGRR
ncbi:MAG: hypothetical protein ACLQCB_21855 [Spirochaetia bacterium]